MLLHEHARYFYFDASLKAEEVEEVSRWPAICRNSFHLPKNLKISVKEELLQRVCGALKRGLAGTECTSWHGVLRST